MAAALRMMSGADIINLGKKARRSVKEPKGPKRASEGLIGRLDRSKDLLAALAPFGPMFDDPIGEGTLEAYIVAEFLGFDPLMLEDLFPFGLELAVQRRVPHQIVRGVWTFHRHSRSVTV